MPSRLTITTKTNALCKLDFCLMYGYPMHLFSAFIEPIKAEIGWRKGRQRFTPTQTRRIIEYLGDPITTQELLSKQG